MRKTGSMLSFLCVLGLVGCAQPESDSDALTTNATEDAPQAASAPEVLKQTSGCSGKPGRLRGRSNQRVHAGNGMRSFIYYAPANLDPNTPAPMVIVPHGFTMSGEQMFGITGYAQLAEREGFIAVFPDGGAGVGPWNVGGGICGNGAFVNGVNNDQAFVDAMIEFADADRCVDRDHVFMNGFSMGGYFSNETGCLNPKIKAVAPHSGGTHNLARCINRPLPVLIEHFKPDSLIGYNCGVDARNKWAQRNGCQLANPDVEQIKGGKCEYYKGCREGGQVAMCTFNEPLLGGGELLAGHGWAGGLKAGGGGSFSIPGPANAAELSWSFFKKYAW